MSFAYSCAYTGKLHRHIFSLTLRFCQADYKINNQTRNVPCPCFVLCCTAACDENFSFYEMLLFIRTCIIMCHKIGFQNRPFQPYVMRLSSYSCLRTDYLDFSLHFENAVGIKKQSHVSTLATNKCILILMKQIDFQPFK